MNKKQLRETNFSMITQLIIINSRANLLLWFPVPSHSKIGVPNCQHCLSIQHNHRFLCSWDKLVINSTTASTTKNWADFILHACDGIAEWWVKLHWNEKLEISLWHSISVHINDKMAGRATRRWQEPQHSTLFVQPLLNGAVGYHLWFCGCASHWAHIWSLD